MKKENRNYETPCIREATYEEVIYEKKFPKWEMPSDEELAEDKVDTDEPKERLTFEQIMEKEPNGEAPQPKDEGTVEQGEKN